MTSSGRPSGPTEAAWEAGALLVANAVPDLAVEVGGRPQATLQVAMGVIREHDWRTTLDQWTGRPVHLPVTAGVGGWEDGFAAALMALARDLPLPAGLPLDPGSVVVIGAPVDRLEADRMSDVAELSRLLRGLGVKVACVWPSGVPTTELSAAAGAGFVVALPHGRAAAEVLASRTGAVLVDAGVPFGLSGTAEWVRAVGAAIGRGEAAQALVASELDRVAPRLEWVVPLWFLHRRFGFGGDRLLAAPFTAFCRELGAEAGDWTPGDVVDLVVGDRHTVEMAIEAGLPHLEWGFPSPGAHALSPAPRLGFDGALAVVEAMMNRMSLCKVLAGIRAQRERRDP